MTIEIKTENSVFVLLAGSTELSKVPGLTAAGASPDLTFLTPVIDSEILLSGKVMSAKHPPMTPDGIPTPAVVTRGCLELTDVPAAVINAGLGIKPDVTYVETGLSPANDPRHGPSAPDFEKAVKRGYIIGKTLLRMFDSIFLAESIPGGTTTALITLRSIGMKLRTSSSYSQSPEDLKDTIVNDSLSSGFITPISYFDSMRYYGDYMMAIALGISSALTDTMIYFSGGTQMATVFHLDRMISGPNRRRSVITTGWIMKDRAETMKTLCGDSLIVSDMNFRESREEGLRKFEEGHVKEGVGMGAAYLIARKNNGRESIMKAIDRTYEDLT